MKMLVFLLVMVFATVHGATYQELVRLHDFLMTNYSKDLRPAMNLSEPTVVNVGFQLISLKDFDEKTSKFAVVGILTIIWTDINLRWNPDEFGGINQILIPQSSLWKPTFVLMNPYDQVKPPGFDSLNINVTNSGLVVWAPPDVYEVTCSADVTYYPFDEQMCGLFFSPYMYTVSDLILRPFSWHIFLDFYYPDSLWELSDTFCAVHTEMNLQNLALMVSIKRRPMFQVLTTIVPFCILGLLNIMVFLLPAGSGERVGFSVTVLLAIAVFMTIVADTLPGTSEPSFPRLCYLLIVELGMNMLVTVSTILVLRLHNKPKHENIPNWLQCIICKCVCACRHNQISKTENGNNIEVFIESILSKNPDSEKAGAENEHIRRWIGDIAGAQERRDNACSKTSWQTFARYSDIGLFVLFTIIFVTNKIAAYFIFS
ncbi:acetylcholine receptor subunit beta-type acr-3-like [Argopecten irradians]|uniref:acetylcholine receptor subunit beta-type acr-3-like n=1 Tax=Argopecten irradians TaxID=31199 RepID=UPI0037119BE5